jgi:hypothetical protein
MHPWMLAVSAPLTGHTLCQVYVADCAAPGAHCRQDCTLEAAGKRLGPLCDLAMLPRLTPAALLSVASRLGEKRLVICEAAAKHLRARLSLAVQRDDVAALVRDDPVLQRIHCML